MEQNPSFLRQPMTLRGVFGISNKIFFKNFWAFTVFTLIVMGIFSLIVGAISLLPTFSMSPAAYNLNNPYAAMEFLGGFMPAFFGIMLIGIIGGTLLSALFSGGVTIGAGVAFSGQKLQLGELLRSSGRLFKRSIVLELCRILYSMCVGIVMMILAVILSLVLIVPLGVAAASGSLDESIGTAIVVVLLLFLVIMAVVLIAMSFIYVIYPVLVNEGAGNFRAIGRSFKLVTKKFGKTLLAQLIPGLIYFGVMLIVSIPAGLMQVSLAGSSAANATLMIVLTLISTVLACIYSAYNGVVGTVLYYDLSAREAAQAAPAIPPAPPVGPAQ